MPRGASTRFMVASGGVLSEGYGRGGPGVCLGDGQKEAKGVPSQGVALLRRMPPYLTCLYLQQMNESRSRTEVSMQEFDTTVEREYQSRLADALKEMRQQHECDSRIHREEMELMFETKVEYLLGLFE